MARGMRQRMIDSASVLIAKRGPQATSFSEVLEKSGAPRGSLYHHFPGGKEELVLASVGAAGERAIASLDALEGRPATEVAEGYLGRWRALLEASGFTAGCAVAAITVAGESAEQQELAAGVFRAWEARLGGLLAAGGVPAARAPELATALIAAGEGAVILARAARSFEPFDRTAAALLALVRSAVSG